jgi:hypothetical protein
MTLKERKMEDIFEAISDTQQRSEEWHAQRMGKFTASRFGDLMTNGRKKDEVLGQTAISYIYEKAAELLTGQRTEIFGKALDWGNEYEPICKAYYSELRGVTIEEMPFVEINDYSGASPDGMVDGELIEIKCPYNTANHLKTAFEGYIDPKVSVADARADVGNWSNGLSVHLLRPTHSRRTLQTNRNSSRSGP